MSEARSDKILAVNPDSLLYPEGPLSHVVVIGSVVYISGQVGIDSLGNVVGSDDVRAQTRQTIRNIETCLEAVGGRISDIVKLTVFLTNMEDRAAVAEVRQESFRAPYPASTLVEVSRLALPELRVEIEAIAILW
jgi:2-iminobutanoate/2-iminopropanoate deaminase